MAVRMPESEVPDEGLVIVTVGGAIDVGGLGEEQV